MSTFVEWIYGELNQHGWTQAELARRSHITPAALSRILNGDRQPGVDTIVGLSRALNVPADEILRHAGLLPPKHAIAADLRQYDDTIATIASLTPENQKLVSDLVYKIKVSEEISRDKRGT